VGVVSPPCWGFVVQGVALLRPLGASALPRSLRPHRHHRVFGAPKAFPRRPVGAPATHVV